MKPEEIIEAIRAPDYFDRCRALREFCFVCGAYRETEPCSCSYEGDEA